jgi:hypothetical protein
MARTIIDDDDLDLEFTEQLTRADVAAASHLGDAEVRYLVDAYYIAQENRKRSAGQVRALAEVTPSHPRAEPNVIVNWLEKQNAKIEAQIKRVLDAYTQAHPMGDWMRSHVGVGPVISAGLLAHIYMGTWCADCHAHDEETCAARQADPKAKGPAHAWRPVDSCPTVGHIWQFAGIAGAGQLPWKKGEKRPHNADLKVLTWKLGQSFMKFHNHPGCYYGAVYAERKAYEIARNVPGGWNKPEVERRLREGIGRKGTEAHTYLIRGLLPPAAMDGRARRYAVKQFLAHMHGVWYERWSGRPAPLPYPIAHLGHAHYIPPPGDTGRRRAAG